MSFNEKLFRLLIRSGFKVELNKNGIDLSYECPDNQSYLKRILKCLNANDVMKEHILCIDKEIEENEWLDTIDELHGGAEGGRAEELGIMDTYIAGIVRWANEIGFRSYYSCDGHQTNPPKISFLESYDGIIFKFFIELLSEGRWTGLKRRDYIILRNLEHDIRDHSQKMWLLDFAEELYKNFEDLKTIYKECKKINTSAAGRL